jgi:hypothetical protein
MFRLLFLNSKFDQAKPGAARSRRDPLRGARSGASLMRSAKFASQHKFWSLTEQYWDRNNKREINHVGSSYEIRSNRGKHDTAIINLTPRNIQQRTKSKTFNMVSNICLISQ